MGLKFLCHHCNEPMHVKNFLAGKRGKCPNCNQSIRIPEEGEEYSRPVTRTEDVVGRVESSQERTEVRSNTKNDVVSKSVSGDSTIASGTKLPVRDIRSESAKGETPMATNASTSPPPLGVITLPRCIEEAPNAAWYVRPPSGGQYGPAVGAVFWDWLKEKRVGESALVWREGWGTWQTASEVFPEFFQKSLSPSNPTQVPPIPDGLVSTAAESLATGIKADTGGKSTAKTSAAVRSKGSKKKNKSKRDIAIFLALSILALVLIGALIWVLISQVK
ncbi:MAG: hypothetical protein RLY14_126 [Planctomycetota bacterium]|jgi:hypothetical protein